MTIRFQANRLAGNPIIVPNMDDRMGANINGPSLIRTPEWLPNPRGKYYLYFGHHRGNYIRLAFADSLTGPWQTYEQGVLDLNDSFFEHHIASPDVLIDEDERRLVMYFHGRHSADGPGQETRVGVSDDGLTFRARPEVLEGLTSACSSTKSGATPSACLDTSAAPMTRSAASRKGRRYCQITPATWRS